MRLSQKNEVEDFIKRTEPKLTLQHVHHLNDLQGHAISHAGDSLRQQYAFWGTNAVRFPSLGKPPQDVPWGRDGRNPINPSDPTTYANRRQIGKGKMTKQQITRLHQAQAELYHLASTFMSLVTKAITSSVSCSPQAGQAALPVCN